MKIQDMVLVVKNIRGNEKNMLMTLEKFKEEYLFVPSISKEEAAGVLKDLFDTKQIKNSWTGRHLEANVSYWTKFCSGIGELQRFLAGSYNDNEEFQFDREESSSECLRALEEYNLGTNGEAKGFMFHYEPVEHNFKQKEILHGFNGIDYIIMECYSANNFLLLDMSSRNFLVAEGVHAYCRYPHAGKYKKENEEVGIDIKQSIYLSELPSEIDFVGLRAEYCEPYHQTGDSFSIEIREVLSRVENIKADCLGSAIDEAMEQYKTEQIVLDSDDRKETRYIPVKNR